MKPTYNGMARDLIFFFGCRQVLFKTVTLSLDHRDSRPSGLGFPLKTCFRYVQLPFTTGLIVYLRYILCAIAELFDYLRTGICESDDKL
jgi:hypothetical protein